MAVVAQRDKLLLSEDPSLVFSIVKVAHDQTHPGSLLARSRGRQDERPWEQGWFLIILVLGIFKADKFCTVDK